MSRQFLSRPSERYLNAVAALRALLEESGDPDVVRRAYAEAVWDAIRDEWYTKAGLRPTRGYHYPGRLLGKSAGDFDREDPEAPPWPPGNDHGSLWLKDGKPAVYVFEPYMLTWETLQELVAYGQRWGFRIDVRADRAWHFPGATLSVTVEPDNGKPKWPPLPFRRGGR